MRMEEAGRRHGRPGRVGREVTRAAAILSAVHVKEKERLSAGTSTFGGRGERSLRCVCLCLDERETSGMKEQENPKAWASGRHGGAGDGRGQTRASPAGVSGVGSLLPGQK